MTEVQNIIDKICNSSPDIYRDYSLNNLSDYYREGEDLRTLIPMLCHQNPEIVSAGAWIASEVVDVDRGREIFVELSQLLSHPDPTVRFWPIECITLLVKASDTVVLQQLVSLIADKNIGNSR